MAIDYEIITRKPQGEARPTPLLFVHGAWHAAWCWDEHFMPYFAEQGYACYVLSLRGHGATPNDRPIRLTGVWHYVADVAHVADQIAAETGMRPAVIGHSMGGYVVQKYLETYQAPAGVLMASIPVSGILGFGLRLLGRHPWPFLKAHLLLNPWHMIGTPALAHEAFFSPQLPMAEVNRHFARLQPESFRLELDAMLLNLPRPQRVKAPILVMAAENDRVFTVAEAKKTAGAYGTTAVILPNMAHDMMLEPDWQHVANHILAWLQSQGL